VAWLHARGGEREEALRWLVRALLSSARQHGALFPWLTADPRYRAVLRAMHMPDVPPA
jgi:ribosome biogenesis SPOUT family RNA methylase Rps3